MIFHGQEAIYIIPKLAYINARFATHIQKGMLQKQAEAEGKDNMHPIMHCLTDRLLILYDRSKHLCS